jgi:hypothetical protein
LMLDSGDRQRPSNAADESSPRCLQTENGSRISRTTGISQVYASLFPSIPAASRRFRLMAVRGRDGAGMERSCSSLSSQHHGGGYPHQRTVIQPACLISCSARQSGSRRMRRYHRYGVTPDGQRFPCRRQRFP